MTEVYGEKYGSLITCNLSTRTENTNLYKNTVPIQTGLDINLQVLFCLYKGAKNMFF